jgi:hypothetical protein
LVSRYWRNHSVTTSHHHLQHWLLAWNPYLLLCTFDCPTLLPTKAFYPSIHIVCKNAEEEAQ